MSTPVYMSQRGDAHTHGGGTVPTALLVRDVQYMHTAVGWGDEAVREVPFNRKSSQM
jgi:hypothetical protein